MSVTIENPAPCTVQKFLIYPFGKLFSKTVTIFKSSSEAPFLRMIGKFKIGLNLEIMQIRVFTKRSYEKTKGSLYFIFTSFDTNFSKLLSSYILSRFRIFSFSYTREFYHFSEGNIASRVYLYIFSGCENCLLKKPCILPVCHTKSFFWPAKIERARRKCIKCTLIYDFSVLNLFS